MGTRVEDHTELWSAVAGELRQAIIDGEFAPGVRLVEADLAERFGTSRGPIRTALAELEATGLVRSVPRRGTYVTSFGPDDLDELYSLRLALERLAIERGIKRCTPDAVERMTRALDELSAAQAAGDRRGTAAADMRFHRELVSLSGHKRLVEAWEQLADQTLFLMHAINGVDPEIVSDLGQHRVVLAAVAAGDLNAALAAIEDHLTSALTTMDTATRVS